MTAYLARMAAATADLGSAVIPIGRAIDCFFNVMFLGGVPGETVSTHAARDAAAGQPWACVLCKALSIIVQPRHCQVTLDPSGVTPLSADARAGAGFLLLAGALAITVFVGVGALVDWLAFQALPTLAHVAPILAAYRVAQ